MNERDVMLWHQEENHPTEWEDDDKEELELFKRDKRADVMIQEINYLETREKPRKSQIEKQKIVKSQVEEIVKDLVNEVGIFK